MSSGRHSFEFVPPAGFAFTPDAIEVRRSLDGTPLLLTVDAWRTLRRVAVSNEPDRGRAVAEERSPMIKVHRRAASG
jgi:hypothetical protein